MSVGSLMFRFEGAEITKLANAIQHPHDYVLITAGPELFKCNDNTLAIFLVKAELFSKETEKGMGQSTGLISILCPVPPCNPTIFDETVDNCEKQLINLIESNKKLF